MNLIQGDCIEKLKDISDNSVDCFICDLPYGTTELNWDKKINLEELWREMKRIASNDNTPYFFFCDIKLANQLMNSNPKMFRYDIVIQKTKKVGFFTARKMPMRHHELLLVFYKKLPTYNIDTYHSKTSITETNYNRDPNSVYGARLKNNHSTTYDPPLPTSILQMNNTKGKRNHPTEKSQDILSWIIKYYTNEGDTILDPTMGSGSTGVACVSLNRKFIGIELDDDYYKVAKERIE